MTVEVMPGCEPMSHIAGSPVGVMALHGFTGTPASLRQIADAMVDAEFDVELPRLPGHGTTVNDMLTTGWDDWVGEVERAYERLAERADRVVLVGQSMGATLILNAALRHRSVVGLVCINPLTRLRDAATMEMLNEFIEDGLKVVPGGDGSDIADPNAVDISYSGTPLVPLRSLMHDGVATITDRFGELTMPLRVLTSRQDHVVDPADSEHLVATWGGVVEHTWLERSYHVATRDYERDYVTSEAVAFVKKASQL